MSAHTPLNKTDALIAAAVIFLWGVSFYFRGCTR